MKNGDKKALSTDALPRELSAESDSTLIRLIRSGSGEAFDMLVQKYKKTVSSLSGAYFSDALTSDDWYQEGMLGLVFAVSSYNAENGTSFSAYAAVCIKNRLNSVWKKANNSKNAPLNESVSLNDSDIPSGSSPEDDYINSEFARLVAESINACLSKTEKRVFNLYLEGLSYIQIAEKLGISEKSVDNAIYRSKKKMREYCTHR